MSETKKGLPAIIVFRKNIRQMLRISRNVRFPKCDQYHPVKETCKKQATYDIDGDHTVPFTSTIQETNFNYTIISKIIIHLLSIQFSTSLLRNGLTYNLTYLELIYFVEIC